jgi:hypothetical protein
MYNMSIEEVLEHLDAVMQEVQHTANLPMLPVIHEKMA